MFRAVGKMFPRDDRWCHNLNSEQDSTLKEGSGNMPGSGNHMCTGSMPGSKAPGSIDGVWRGKAQELEAGKVRLKLWFAHLSTHQHYLEAGVMKTPIPGPHPQNF